MLFHTVYDMCAYFRVPVLPLGPDERPNQVGYPPTDDAQWCRTARGRDYIGVMHPHVGNYLPFIDGMVMHELAHILAGPQSTEDDEMGALVIQHTLILRLVPQAREAHIHDYEGYGFRWEDEQPWHPDHGMLCQSGVIGDFKALPRTKAWHGGCLSLRDAWNRT